MTALRRLTTREEVLAVAGDDPFVRYDVVERPERAWALGPAVAVTRAGHSGLAGLSAWVRPSLGYVDGGRWDPDSEPALSALLSALIGRGGPERGVVDRVSVPLGAEHLLASHARVLDGGDWEWMATKAAPPSQPREDELVELDDTADAAALRELAEADNPLSEGEPGTGRTERWLGVRSDAGRVVACGAWHRTQAGYVHLAGILVARHLRGGGYGRAITAALTRDAVAADGVCTLGMYADNDVARRLYHALGYATAHAWASRRLAWD